ncbi:hypothetical protein BSIN_3063 [Burkholderia singularis]|uniref:Uncharacterized protein n=1 Tax=Burkholderia singularis TaxID=1503053 RepID=A0A238H3H9_9BURK|nr:hypothetical protein BSIN_3063 [Burkholderia singularis]
MTVRGPAPRAWLRQRWPQQRVIPSSGGIDWFSQTARPPCRRFGKPGRRNLPKHISRDFLLRSGRFDRKNRPREREATSERSPTLHCRADAARAAPCAPDRRVILRQMPRPPFRPLHDLQIPKLRIQKR